MKVAVVGVTGMVGRVMCQVLEEQNLPITEFYPVASERSVGQEVTLHGKVYKVISLQDGVNAKPDIALFSAGGDISLEWAPKFAEVGTTVIDNSSAWRMDPTKKLVVPEINGTTLTATDKIIANPNCSTIQLVMALAPLHRVFGLDRLVISTYQSVTGTGVKAVEQMMAERKGETPTMVYKHAIDMNCIPHCDVFLENGYTKEEMKLVNETRKILGDNSLRITATAVRVPVVGGHSESINATFKKPITLTEVREILNTTQGISLVDNTDKFEYPMPLNAHGKDEVLVGRLRLDESQDNTINLWVVADNLRKGAATNAVQIAKLLYNNKLV